MSCYKFGLPSEKRLILLNISYKGIQTPPILNINSSSNEKYSEDQGKRKTLWAKCSNISYEELITINIKT